MVKVVMGSKNNCDDNDYNNRKLYITIIYFLNKIINLVDVDDNGCTYNKQ
jgi:hypothetical protein